MTNLMTFEDWYAEHDTLAEYSAQKAWQASEANQQAEIDALKYDLDSYMKIAHASATEIVQQAQTIAELVKSVGNFNDLHTDACGEIERLNGVIAELVEALELWAGLINYQYTGSKEAMSALQICDDFGQKVLAKVKGK